MVRPLVCALLLTTALAAQTLTDLQRRAAAGDHDAQTALGTLFETGDGVPLDPSRAVTLYREAAAAGHVGALINLGTMYLDGAGVQRDPVAAVRWLTRAAAAGSALAQLNLGMIYDAGDPPVKADAAQAARRYGQAAAQGLMPAQYRLARLYEDGRGVPRDLDQAASWYRKAADQTDPAAQLRHLRLLHRAVLAHEVDERGQPAPGGHVLHLHQRAGRPVRALVAFERPHLQLARRRLELLDQLADEHTLVGVGVAPR